MLSSMNVAETLLPDPEACERARQARDPRFDGRFFVAVRSTGIYCRPVCPAPTAKASNVSYFPTAAAAAEAGFRPCLRCRPETAPGTPAWQGTSTTVARGLRLIAEGALDEGSVEQLATRLGVTSRHLSRLFREHLGASPVAVAQTRRLQFAKRLIDETQLGFAEIAAAAGFGSLRRFNHLVRQTWGRSPGELRQLRRQLPVDHGIAMRIPYREPFDWPHWLEFLSRRAIPGVERVTTEGYSRVVSVAKDAGWLTIQPITDEAAALLTVHNVPPVALFGIVQRTRALLDADAEPARIGQLLARDPVLAECVTRRPGLRIAGAFDAFELSVRAILGQQVSVAAATTLAGRLVSNFGERLPQPFEEGLTHAFPRPAALAHAPLEQIGLPTARAAALRALAAACADGRVDFSIAPADLCAALESLPGIGPWTAQYVAMRALRDPDALPAGDLVLRKMLGNGTAISTKEAERRAESWRPWRAYGLIHLWAAADELQQPKVRARRISSL